MILNGRLAFNCDEHVLYADGEPVKLTATETKIVELLMRNPGRIFPAEEIYSKIWNESAYSTENTVMVHIRRIREKIELNPSEPEYLKWCGALAIKWKSTEKKGGDLFRGAVSWLCFLILLCTFTSGGLPAGSPLPWTRRWPPASGTLWCGPPMGTTPGGCRWRGGCLVLFFAGLLALTIAFTQDRKAFEDALARWLRRIWVEVKLLAIARGCWP